MQQIVSFSGGIGSFFTLERVYKKYDHKDITVVFMDTKSEDEDLYRFCEEVKKLFNDIQYINLMDGRTIWECAYEDKFLYNSRIANCTKKLKQIMFKRWLKGNYKPNECILHIGFGWEEPNRCEAVIENYKPYKVEFVMMEKPYYFKNELLSMLKNEFKIEPPRLYTMGFSHNNCGGFCFKAGAGHFKLLLEKMPERYAYHEEMERRLAKIIFDRTGRKVSILKRVKNGKKINLTLEQLRLDMEQKEQYDELCEFGGCNCFVDFSLKRKKKKENK